MARKDANPGQKEQAAERHVQAFELRKQGYSYRDIGAALGVSHKTAWEDVQRVLAELAETRLTSAAAYVDMELEHLDMAQQALHQHLETGDPQIINSWVKVSESRRKLLGLDAQPLPPPATAAPLLVVIMQALAEYPEARVKVAAMLAEQPTEVVDGRSD